MCSTLHFERISHPLFDPLYGALVCQISLLREAPIPGKAGNYIRAISHSKEAKRLLIYL